MNTHLYIYINKDYVYTYKYELAEDASGTANARERGRALSRLERAKIASGSAPRRLERANIASGSAFRRSNELLERSKDDLGSILVDLSSILHPQRVDSGGFSTLFRCVRARAG